MAAKCRNCAKAHGVDMIERDHYQVCVVATALAAYNQTLTASGRPVLTQQEADRVMRRVSPDALTSVIAAALAETPKED